MRPQTEAFRRKRNFFLVLPLLVMPFLTLAFWALGGGKGGTLPVQQAGEQQGLNLQLPEPHLQATATQDKLSLYKQLQRELLEKEKYDASPFLQPPGEHGNLPAEDVASSPLFNKNSPMETSRNEARINQRLAQLSAMLNQQPATASPPAVTSLSPLRRSRTPATQDLDRLEDMLHTLSGNKEAGDPEMQQLEGMLDRILDIQHPERVRERIQHQSQENGQQAFALHTSLSPVSVTLLERPAPSGQPPHFLGLDPDSSAAPLPGNTLQAVIHETQTFATGAMAKIRMEQEAYLGGRLLPKGSIVYGTCQVKGERLLIKVSGVRIGNSLLPAKLTAYDLDGQEGLYIPDAAIQQAARQGADRMINQSLQVPALSPSLGAQAASTGLEAVKGLFSRKNRLVKVRVRAGYQLLLRDQ